MEEKRQRKLENQKKGEVVQQVRLALLIVPLCSLLRVLFIVFGLFLQITNSAKLKRLNKKQLKSIQKR